MNGKVERRIQTIKGLLRASMKGVDPLIWDFCTKYIEECLNTIGHKGQKTPQNILQEITKNPLEKMRSSRAHHMRRFGCLVFAKVNPSSSKHKRFPGVNLGFSMKNSSYRVGVLDTSNKLKVYETRDCIFEESILVPSLSKLRDSVSLSLTGLRSELGAAPTLEFSDGLSSGTGGVLGEAKVSLDTPPFTGSSPDDTSGFCVGSSMFSSSLKRGSPSGVPEILDPETTQTFKRRKTTSGFLPNMISSDTAVTTDSTRNVPLTQEQFQRFTTEELASIRFGAPAASETKKPKGRPRGSKDKNPAGRKKGSGLRKQIQDLSDQITSQVDLDTFRADVKQYLSNIENEKENSFWSLDDDEELVEVELALSNTEYTEMETFVSQVVKGVREDPTDTGPTQISAKQAEDPNNPDFPSWIKARNKELVKLLAYKCWRTLQPHEFAAVSSGKIKPVPSCLLYTKKRNGTFKCRCVILGNQMKGFSNIETFAGVVSAQSNRQTLIHGASKGWYLTPFDVTNAFIQAPMEDGETGPIIISLPEIWRKTTDSSGKILKNPTMVKLLKAMYGLPMAPRIWRLCLAKSLVKLGFVESSAAPEVWKKLSENKEEVTHILTVYVDDVVLMSKSKTEADQLFTQIKELHEFSYIPPKTEVRNGDSYDVYDVCGCDVAYCRSKRTLEFSMETYAKRLIDQYGMSNSKNIDTPWFDLTLLTENSPIVEDFNLRQLTGSLQWLATCCRPDLVLPTQLLASVTCKPVTKTIIAACKRVLRYLNTTLKQKISYSPQNEQNFKECYRKFLGLDENKDGDTEKVESNCQSFSDASFGTSLNLKSVSGQTHYYKGCLVAWRSSRQTVTAASTYEAEWVALSECLGISEEVNQLDHFLNKAEFNEKEFKTEFDSGSIWCDNKAVVINSKKDQSDLNRKSRFIALKMAKVLEHQRRVLFVPTWAQKADALTKLSNSPSVYDLIFDIQGVLSKQKALKQTGESRYESYYLKCFITDMI